MIRPEEFASGCKMCKSGAGISLQGLRSSEVPLSLLLHLRCHHHRCCHRRRRRLHHCLQLSPTEGLKIQWNDSNIRKSSKRLNIKNRWVQRDVSLTATFLPSPIFSLLFCNISILWQESGERPWTEDWKWSTSKWRTADTVQWRT